MNTTQSVPGLVTSRNHPLVRRVRSLHSPVERDRTGTFLAEGVRFLVKAFDHGARIESLLIAPQLLVSVPGRKLIGTLRRAGVPCVEVTPEVLHSAAQADDPQGVVAVLRQDWTSLRQAVPNPGTCWVAMSAVQSSGNLGTLLRTCEAVGADGIILLSDSGDPFDPSAVRASMGSLFSQRLVRATPTELLKWKSGHGCTLVGTSPSAQIDYQELDYRGPVVLFMGWERRGLSAEEQSLCDQLVRIPMAGGCDSLNVAVATSVLLYEVFNQRRRARSKKQEASQSGVER